MINVYWSPVINVQDNQEFVSELKYFEPETIYKDIKPREFFGLGAGMCPAIVDEAKNTFRAKSPIDFAMAIFVDPSRDIKILLVTLKPSLSISFIKEPFSLRRIILVAHIA